MVAVTSCENALYLVEIIYQRKYKYWKREQLQCNLDDSKGPVTHWVYYRNKDRHLCEYFDLFGLIMPYFIKKYLKTSGKKIQQMKYRKEIVFYAVIGVYIIFWRDKKVDQY